VRSRSGRPSRAARRSSAQIITVFRFHRRAQPRRTGDRPAAGLRGPASPVAPRPGHVADPPAHRPRGDPHRRFRCRGPHARVHRHPSPHVTLRPASRPKVAARRGTVAAHRGWGSATDGGGGGHQPDRVARSSRPSCGAARRRTRGGGRWWRGRHTSVITRSSPTRHQSARSARCGRRGLHLLEAGSGRRRGRAPATETEGRCCGRPRSRPGRRRSPSR
jgi:hypothetical protein